MKLSFAASRRLDDLTEEATEEHADRLADEHVDAFESRVEERVDDDDLLRETVAVETTLDRQANVRRKATADPWDDAVLADLREAREAARSAAEERLAEVAREALDAVAPEDAAAAPEVSGGE